MTIHVVTWKWKQPGFRIPYGADHVNAMRFMLERYFTVPHRMLCITDDAEGIDTRVDTAPLWNDHATMINGSGKQLPSCYRRLKLFDPETQESLGIAPNDRILSIDLDTVLLPPFTRAVEPLLPSKFRWVGWRVRGTYHPWVFNGSFWLFNARDFANLWTDFDPKTTPNLMQKRGFFGSDQSWLSYNLAKASDSHGLKFPEIASYPREVRRSKLVDKKTGMIFFHGTLKPWHDQVQREAPWIKAHWRLP